MEIRGAVVLITGAAQGIGAACASLFAEAGAQVALLDVDGERPRASAPDGALSVVGDVTGDGVRRRSGVIVATKFPEHALAGAAPADVEGIRRVMTRRGRSPKASRAARGD